MGQMDRDYWRDRYNKETNAGKDLNEIRAEEARPPRPPRDLTFMDKFLTIVVVALIFAVAYRYMR
jgi:hypothetical protein